MDLNLVNEEQLTGYRKPTSKEKEWIAGYMDRQNRKTGHIMSFWKAACSVFAGGLFLDSVIGIGGKPWPYLLFEMVVFGVFAVIVFCISLSGKKKKAQMQTIHDGTYQVLDCYAYEVISGSQFTVMAEAKIMNEAGQRCGTKFLLGEDDAKRWRTDPKTRLLLIRYGGNSYELISKNKMEA